MFSAEQRKSLEPVGNRKAFPAVSHTRGKLCCCNRFLRFREVVDVEEMVWHGRDELRLSCCEQNALSAAINDTTLTVDGDIIRNMFPSIQPSAKKWHRKLRGIARLRQARAGCLCERGGMVAHVVDTHTID